MLTNILFILYLWVNIYVILVCNLFLCGIFIKVYISVLYLLQKMYLTSFHWLCFETIHVVWDYLTSKDLTKFTYETIQALYCVGYTSLIIFSIFFFGNWSFKAFYFYLSENYPFPLGFQISLLKGKQCRILRICISSYIQLSFLICIVCFPPFVSWSP